MSNVLNKNEFNLATTAFGDLAVESLTPLVQITAQYGFRDDVLVANLGTSATTTANSKFIVNAGAVSGNVGTVVSAREANYRPGQGLTCRLTAMFTANQPNSTQYAGFITSESAFAFGYNGDEFGITRSHDGDLEIYEIQITSAGTGDAVFTIDGQADLITLIAGTVEDNAYQIAVELNASINGYTFTALGDTVTALAQLPDLGGGIWNVSVLASGVVATFTEIQAGTIMTDEWTPKSQWNVNPDIDIDPTLGNVYQIQIQYLGFGGIKFFVENPATANYELVHIIQYANTSLIPSVRNPIFRIGWAARNNGTTTQDVIVQGASGAMFVEGNIHLDGNRKAECTEAAAIGTTRTNILAIRNRLTFNNIANRAEIIPGLLSLATDSTKTAIFEVVLDPVVAPGDTLSFTAHGANELAEISTSNVAVTGGNIIMCFNVKAAGSFQVDLADVLQDILPGQVASITAKVSASPTSIMDAAVNWRDDL